MTGERRAVWVAGAAFALAVLGCGSITPLDGVDGGGSSPPGVTMPDAALISIRTGDDAAPSPPATEDAGASTSNAGTGGATGTGGGKGDAPSCVIQNNCHGLLCNVFTGLCVECLVNADCKGKTKLCDLTTLTCLGCSSDGDSNGDCDGN